MEDSKKQEKLQRELSVNGNIMYTVKSLLRKCIPNIGIHYWHEYKQKKTFRQGMRKLSQYSKVENIIRSHSVVKVAFFVVESSMWKYDELFKLFLDSPSFDPKVVICPYLNYHGSQMERIMEEAETFFHAKGYPYIKTWNAVSHRFLDIKKIFSPDIIFYCFPYMSAIKESLYGIFHFPNALICYVPYSSMICNTKNQFDKVVQNFSWGFFVENNLVKKLVEQYSPTQGINAIATGCPTLDVYRRTDYKPHNVWKHTQPVKIIWAPHYTIVDGMVGISFSTFLQYSDGMVELAKKYSDHIQIAFKPHPFLYPTLCTYWGKDKTDAYYDLWRNMNNTQYVTGDYTDLFKTSNAMIFDSVSFVVEYLYTRNPSLFTYKEGVENLLNEYGVKAFSCHAKAKKLQDIDDFIQGLLLNKQDELAEQKQDFYDSYLSLPQGYTAADNIYNYIATKLNK